MSGVLAIDPGFNTGWAYWKEKPRSPGQPDKRGLVKPAPGVAGDDRSLAVANRMAHIVEMDLPDVEFVYIERPEVFGGGKALASALRGDISKLILTTGCIAGAISAHGIRVRFIPVRDWKGQLSDGATDRRIALLLDVKSKDFKMWEKSDHIRDAVGIGLHGMGFEL